MVFPTFFNLSLNLAIRSSWSEPQSAPGLVFVDCIEHLHLWLQKYNQSDFCVDYLVMCRCRIFSCVIGRGCLLWPMRSLGKTLLLFALLHSVFQGQICLLPQGVSCLPTFAFQSPIMKRRLFLGVLVLKGLVGLNRTIQLLQCYWLGHRLGLLWYWMVYLGNEQRSFYLFWDCIQVLHFRLYCWPWWLLHFS